MIKIKMYKAKWQIHLGDEVWQFDSKKDFEETLKKLIEFKGNYGNIRNRE